MSSTCGAKSVPEGRDNCMPTQRKQKAGGGVARCRHVTATAIAVSINRPLLTSNPRQGEVGCAADDMRKNHAQPEHCRH